jgi:fatty acid desaturase
MSIPDRVVLTSSETTENVEAWQIKSSPILSVQDLAKLNRRSDCKGWQQLTVHLTVMALSGTVWSMNWGSMWIAIPALVIYGFSLASMFAALHECVHRTAFASQRVNDSIAWIAGVLSFYNSTFYRRYHKWHHRYTQVVGKDPELEDAIPTNWRTYLWQMTGIPWWLGKIRGHSRAALGKFEGCPYISENARNEVMRSTRWQLAVYGLAIALSLVVQHPWFITYWLLPLAIGQPILRFILIAEHTGCPQNDNPLANTRTTLTAWPIRLLMWNMPFHAEHHLYASIPFHALPQAHDKLANRLMQVAPGYLAVNRQIMSQFGSVA